MAYATLQEVLDRMGHGDVTSQPLLSAITDALEAATASIDSYTGRSFSTTTATRTFGASGCELRVPDLQTVTTLKLDDDDDGVFETTIAATGYELDTWNTATGWPFEIVRLLDRSFPSHGRRRRRVQIAGTWGWAAVPDPVNQACSLLAARWALRAKTAPYGYQSFGELGAVGIRSVDPDFVAMLAPYRRPVIG